MALSIAVDAPALSVTQVEPPGTLALTAPSHVLDIVSLTPAATPATEPDEDDLGDGGSTPTDPTPPVTANKWTTTEW